MCGRLRHEVHAAEDDVCRLRPSSRFLGQLEAVAHDIGELDHLIALVVVTQHEHLVPEGGLGGTSPFHQAPVRRCRQLTGALDASLGGEVAALTEDEQGQRGVARLFRCGAHASIVCRLKSHP